MDNRVDYLSVLKNKKGYSFHVKKNIVAQTGWLDKIKPFIV